MEDSSSIGLVILSIVYIAIIVLVVAAYWKIYVKAGEPGWACLVPIYNIIVFLRIVQRPIWWIVLAFIPVVNLILIVAIVDLAKSFGKGVGFAIGLIFLPFIFYPILGFGDAQYTGIERPQ
jgi:hypothetical protein